MVTTPVSWSTTPHLPTDQSTETISTAWRGHGILPFEHLRPMEPPFFIKDRPFLPQHHGKSAPEHHDSGYSTNDLAPNFLPLDISPSQHHTQRGMLHSQPRRLASSTRNDEKHLRCHDDRHTTIPMLPE